MGNLHLSTVRPLYNCIRKRCKELQLKTNLAIDEQMIPFKGNLNVKQYVKGKPCLWVIKLQTLCGASGILYDFLLYEGLTTELNALHTQAIGQSAAIVTTLCGRITQPNYKLFFDHYYSNYQLLLWLQNTNIYATCTARISRFVKPSFLKNLNRKLLGEFPPSPTNNFPQGLPSSSKASSLATPTSSKRKRQQEVCLIKEVRLDGIGHLLDFDDKPSQSRWIVWNTFYVPHIELPEAKQSPPSAQRPGSSKSLRQSTKLTTFNTSTTRVAQLRASRVLAPAVEDQSQPQQSATQQ
ncbi:hypothetical protein ILUMI_25391 [Ignelater luminosus]|uniref:PiggyBac transposable element-derived protein domain-containing protein n=1 Tax=Ignelater luminosus TaxID=2038154 RepID=A0A8K0FZZ8_IGNLU|nr:hypothetical protein ILUMI_25391 [Ignelater luminosus]